MPCDGKMGLQLKRSSSAGEFHFNEIHVACLLLWSQAFEAQLVKERWNLPWFISEHLLTLYHTIPTFDDPEKETF